MLGPVAAARVEVNNVRMTQLSERSGVSIATIKYYRREGLLPAGVATAPNQARYEETHLERLRLIRVLREVADLPVAAIRDVLAAVDDPDREVHDVVGVAHRALDPADVVVDDRAARVVDDVLRAVGWRVSEDAPARDTLARALHALQVLGTPATMDALVRYAAVADQLAADEVALTYGGPARSREELVAGVVIGTVLYEQVLCALRRLGHEHHSARLVPPPA